jgi:hypothetical protein
MPTPRCVTPFVTTSVACAIDPSVNEHIEGSWEFSFQTQFLQICSNFQQQNPPKHESSSTS